MRQPLRWRSLPALLLFLGLLALLQGSVVLLLALVVLLQGLAPALLPNSFWVVLLAPLVLVVLLFVRSALPLTPLVWAAPQASTVLIEQFRVAVAISKAGWQATPGAARAATATTAAGGCADGDVTACMSTAATATVTAVIATATVMVRAATMPTAHTPDDASWFAPGTKAGHEFDIEGGINDRG